MKSRKLKSDEIKLIKQQISKYAKDLPIQVQNLLFDYVETIIGKRFIATTEQYDPSTPFDDEHYVYIKSIVTRLKDLTKDVKRPEDKQKDVLYRGIEYHLEPLPDPFKYTSVEFEDFKQEHIEGVELDLLQEWDYRRKHEGFVSPHCTEYVKNLCITRENVHQLALEEWDHFQKNRMKDR